MITTLSTPSITNQCNKVLRLLWQSLKNDATDFKRWESTSCYFPDLTWHEDIKALNDLVENIVGVRGKRSGPQIIFHLPDAEDCNRELFGTHVDQVPQDATEKFYTLIVAVALNDWTESNGTVWTNGAKIYDGRKYISVSENNLMLMDGKTAHGLGTNKSGAPRIGVYFRWYV